MALYYDQGPSKVPDEEFGGHKIVTAAQSPEGVPALNSAVFDEWKRRALLRIAVEAGLDPASDSDMLLVDSIIAIIASERPMQQSPTDTSNGALMPVGAFGTGSTANQPPPTIADFDEKYPSGSYRFPSSAANSPGSYGVCWIIGRDGSVTGELALSADGSLSYRCGTSDGFGPFRRSWDTGNQGHGSGMDADTVDGYDGDDLVLKSGGTITGPLHISYGDFDSADSGTLIFGFGDRSRLTGNEANNTVELAVRLDDDEQWILALNINRVDGRVDFINTPRVGSRYIYHGGNTTVDSNGFIKKASPIVKLYADHLTTNNPFRAEFERLGVGHYLVHNDYGFAQEGWYIENPTDANKRVKVFVEYEQLDDMTIEVKTYTPDRTGADVTAGEPADIPKGRWIDLRLNMPEPDQPADGNEPA